MASTSEIRKGLCIEMNNDIFTVVDFQHVKPGKGAAFVYVKIKSLTNGKVLEQNIPAGHKVDDVRVERRKFQYLYKDETGFNFMDNESYEQVTLDESMIENHRFLKEGGEVEVVFHAAKNIPLNVSLPQHLVFEITYAEPAVKGDTSTNASKYATIETGAEIKVPLFINQGDFVKVDTTTGDYLERVKQ
ncbi:MAG: elongation factor P [Saprospiraceae bacterium]|nr:elongation factor P [Saprospiraceae bacterium]MBP7679786.1 elongation factor P [Saprospiraceae bacterium]